MTIRIYLPYGAHLRFEGCSKFTKTEPQPNVPGTITFAYTARDQQGNVTTRKAAARFSLDVVCGYSVEEPEAAGGTA